MTCTPIEQCVEVGAGCRGRYWERAAAIGSPTSHSIASTRHGGEWHQRHSPSCFLSALVISVCGCACMPTSRRSIGLGHGDPGHAPPSEVSTRAPARASTRADKAGAAEAAPWQNVGWWIETSAADAACGLRLRHRCDGCGRASGNAATPWQTATTRACMNARPSSWPKSAGHAPSANSRLRATAVYCVLSMKAAKPRCSAAQCCRRRSRPAIFVTARSVLTKSTARREAPGNMATRHEEAQASLMQVSSRKGAGAASRGHTSSHRWRLLRSDPPLIVERVVRRARSLRHRAHVCGRRVGVVGVEGVVPHEACF